jgi:hypothetical protein
VTRLIAIPVYEAQLGPYFSAQENRPNFASHVLS